MLKYLFVFSIVLSCSTGGQVSQSSKSTNGAINPDIIRKVLINNIPQFRLCYQAELGRVQSGHVSSSLRLLFTITSNGSVEESAVDQTTMSYLAKNCIVDALSKIKFPEMIGGGSVEVKQPFNFYPKGS
jgi:hypothetical protein